METEWVLSIAQYMKQTKRLTDRGFELLSTVQSSYQRCLYHSIVITLLHQYRSKVYLDKAERDHLQKVYMDSFIRFHTLKKELNLFEVESLYHEKKDAFTSFNNDFG